MLLRHDTVSVHLRMCSISQHIVNIDPSEQYADVNCEGPLLTAI